MVRPLENKAVLNSLIRISFENHKSTVRAGGCVMYDYFVSCGFLQRNPEQIKAATKEARSALGSFFAPDGASVINYAKALIVDAFFIDLKLNNKHIRELLSGGDLELNK